MPAPSKKVTGQTAGRAAGGQACLRALPSRWRALQTDDDLFAVRGRELYWLPSAGLMDSAVGMDGITKTIGPNTMRTKGTLDQLAAKFF